MRLSLLLSKIVPKSSEIIKFHPPVFLFPFCGYNRRSSATASGSYCATTGNCTGMASSASPKPPAVGNPKLPREFDEVVGIAKKCWLKFRKEVTFALYTPFIVCLASGNLKVETFRHCIAQDVYFLKPFARAFELAEEYAEDDDAKHGISELRKITLNKLNTHDSFVQILDQFYKCMDFPNVVVLEDLPMTLGSTARVAKERLPLILRLEEWGSDGGKDATLNPATAKCTDFLLATASGKIDGFKPCGKLATPFEKTKLSAYTLGAMTSCITLYAYIGKELQGLIDSKSNHLYKKWIKNYSSESFQEFSLKTEELLDNLSVSLTGEELGIIEKLYCQGIKHEMDFFLAQPLAQKVVIPLSGEHNLEKRQLMIFCDFDLTCTVLDSSAILAEIAIVTAPKSADQSGTENQIARMTSADLRNTWGALSKQYTEDYEQCIENMLVTEKAEKLNYEGLRKALEPLSDFEKKANSRVIESGVLKGLNLEDIKRAGERLILHDGCMNFFQTLMRKENLNADVHVLSYCWCGDLIRSSFSAGGLNDIKVHANEFEFEESLCTGEIVKKVESPIDKVQAFSKILESCGNDKKKLNVYIGDSVGDMLCLLRADVGIVVGSSASLRKLGRHFGVRFVPLFCGVVEKQKEYVEGGGDTWKGLSGVLYTVSSWAEIHAFVIGS